MSQQRNSLFGNATSSENSESAFGLISLLWSPNDPRPIPLIFDTLTDQQKLAFEVLVAIDCDRSYDFSLRNIARLGSTIAKILDGKADDEILKGFDDFKVWNIIRTTEDPEDPMLNIQKELQLLLVCLSGNILTLTKLDQEYCKGGFEHFASLSKREQSKILESPSSVVDFWESFAQCPISFIIKSISSLNLTEKVVEIVSKSFVPHEVEILEFFGQFVYPDDKCSWAEKAFDCCKDSNILKQVVMSHVWITIFGKSEYFEYASIELTELLVCDLADYLGLTNYVKDSCRDRVAKVSELSEEDQEKVLQNRELFTQFWE
jgi:hypothetical protein